MTILFADDHFLILEGLKDLVERSFPEAKVILAVNKSELFDKLSKESVDILIQDLKFGKDHAGDFLKEIKNEYQQTKILILSSISDASTIQKLYKKTNGYILKSEPTAVICDAIQAVVDGEKFMSPAAEKITKQLFNQPEIIPLTKRELDVVKEIMKEFPTKTIASNLQISEKTVEMHRANIYLKLDVSNMTGLVKKVIGQGLIDS